MYEIIFTDKAKREFLKLGRNVQEQIGAGLERIKIRPEHFVEKLVGEPGFKLRIGNYRLFLDIYNDKLVILILRVRHRKNAYKD
ncbi:type II toxin-antitoxin system RelE/ParE family toxin [Candidatus Pacearchaeota archaeon]|nr:type II toxin-antitoxin system RelE/ParE family toxin [Candidatus Pacearchaeota archaeon]